MNFSRTSPSRLTEVLGTCGWGMESGVRLDNWGFSEERFKNLPQFRVVAWKMVNQMEIMRISQYYPWLDIYPACVVLCARWWCWVMLLCLGWYHGNYSPLLCWPAQAAPATADRGWSGHYTIHLLPSTPPPDQTRATPQPAACHWQWLQTRPLSDTFIILFIGPQRVICYLQ